ncbi:MAG: hypothetical protein PUB21_09565 [Bacteroidales bacterium]|nr:hypothetical protein [Bacteroidales bacterium]
MKQFLLLFALCLATQVSVAAPQVLKADSVIEKNAANENTTMHVFRYDLTGNLEVDTYYQWIRATSSWMENEKEQNFYNTTSGEMDSTLLYVMIPGQTTWKKSEKTQYFYEAQKCTLQVESNWDADNQVWIEENKRIYTYDANGNLTLDEGYKFVIEPGVGEGWVQEDKTAYTYSEGKLAREEESIYENSQWMLNTATDYTYNDDGTVAQEEESSRDNQNNTWVKSEKTVYTYDAAGNLLAEQIYEWENNTYLLEVTSTYYYSGQVGIEDAASGDFAQPYVACTGGGEAHIFNLPPQSAVALYTIGGTLLQQAIPAAEQYELSLPQRGQYLIVITGTGKPCTLKVGY